MIDPPFLAGVSIAQPSDNKAIARLIVAVIEKNGEAGGRFRSIRRPVHKVTRAEVVVKGP
jgi:hypothetical protein